MCDKCKCKGILKRKGLLLTGLRRYVIKVLTAAGGALAPSIILQRVRAFSPINKVTLYRILDLYEAKNVVRKVLASGRAARYELVDARNTGRERIEPHFVCRECKKIYPLNIPALRELVEKELRNKYGQSLEIAVAGVCPVCRKKGGA